MEDEQSDLSHIVFPKIPTSLQQPPVKEWIATEKIHGAQLIIGTDGLHVRFGKRKSWLVDDDVFFGWQLLRTELTTQIKNFYKKLSTSASIYLYGELFGGKYPHETIGAHTIYKPVQTGVWYCPDIRWALFDVLVSTDEPYFLADKHIRDLSSDIGILCTPLLCKGTWSDVNQLPIRYITSLPQKFNLPQITNNFAEGYVLKPSAQCPAKNRSVVKRKIPEFDDMKFNQSLAFDPGALIGFENIRQVALSLLSKARIASASSKVGENDGEILEECIIDIIIDLEETWPKQMKLLDEEHQTQLQDAIKQQFYNIYK